MYIHYTIHVHVHVHTVYVYMFAYILQLKEMWIANAGDSSDRKIRDECQPGKPVSVFSGTAHKVRGMSDEYYNHE